MSPRISNRFIRKNALWLFFALTYALTFGLAVLGMQKSPWLVVPPGVAVAAAILYHWGPALAAFIAAAAGGRRSFAHLLGGLRFRQVSPGWYFFIALLPLFTHFAARQINDWMGGPAAQPYDAGGVMAGALNPLSFIILAIGILFQAGLAEEIGWRGYALPRLLDRYGMVRANLILAGIWCLWHYLAPGSLALLAERGLWFFFSVLAATCLMTWIYLRTDGNLWLVILFHTSFNAIEGLLPVLPQAYGGSDQVYLLNTILLCAVTPLVIVSPRILRLLHRPAAHLVTPRQP